MDIAITRELSPSLLRCELTHLAREPIDYPRAVAQHHAAAAFDRPQMDAHVVAGVAAGVFEQVAYGAAQKPLIPQVRLDGFGCIGRDVQLSPDARNLFGQHAKQVYWLF